MLTPRQSKLLTYIVAYQREHACASPSIREMTAFLGCKSVSAAHKIMERLEGRGFIRTTPGKMRSIYVRRTEEPTEREVELEALLAQARLALAEMGRAA